MVHILSVAAIVLGLIASPVRAEEADPAKTPFAAVGTQFIEAFNRKDVAAVAALYAEDAIRVNSGGMIRGRAAIQRAIGEGLEAGAHDLKLRYHAAQIDGNTGWSVAEYDFQTRGKDGTATPVHGLATVAWIRDGQAWKIKVHTLVNTPPPK